MAFLQLVKINMCIQAYNALRFDGVISISEFTHRMMVFLLKYDALNEDEKKEFRGYLDVVK